MLTEAEFLSQSQLYFASTWGRVADDIMSHKEIYDRDALSLIREYLNWEMNRDDALSLIREFVDWMYK